MTSCLMGASKRGFWLSASVVLTFAIAACSSSGSDGATAQAGAPATAGTSGAVATAGSSGSVSAAAGAGGTSGASVSGGAGGSAAGAVGGASAPGTADTADTAGAAAGGAGGAAGAGTAGSSGAAGASGGSANCAGNAISLSANGTGTASDAAQARVEIDMMADLPIGNARRTVEFWAYIKSSDWVPEKNEVYVYGSPKTANTMNTAFGVDFGTNPVMGTP
ncbi:MAG TPA: hypothetical protein VHW01_00665, partial [Polyangiaceae bacterium]|nr:hypothetical protein [Polyangiaceae bacterium]